MEPRPWWWWPYQLWKYLVVAPVAAVATLVGSTMVVVLISFVDPSLLSRWVGGTWARILAWITPMPVTVVGRENIDPAQSYVVVSNHQSLFDILVLYGWLGIDFRWVMKIELRSVIGLGAACEKLGHIYIDRSNHDAAIRSINEAKQQIRGGTSVVFFPEGTRSCDGEMRRFKKGAFRFAADADLPVLPVTVDGTCKVLPPHRYDLRPGRSRLVIHPPLNTDGNSAADISKLSETTRSVIGSALPDADE